MHDMQHVHYCKPTIALALNTEISQRQHTQIFLPQSSQAHHYQTPISQWPLYCKHYHDKHIIIRLLFHSDLYIANIIMTSTSLSDSYFTVTFYIANIIMTSTSLSDSYFTVTFILQTLSWQAHHYHTITLPWWPCRCRPHAPPHTSCSSGPSCPPGCYHARRQHSHHGSWSLLVSCTGLNLQSPPLGHLTGRQKGNPLSVLPC